MADGNLESNAAPKEFAAEGAEAVGKSAMEHALNDVRSESTVSGAKSGTDTKPPGGLPTIDIAMHEKAHAELDPSTGAKTDSTTAAHEAAHGAIEGAGKGGAGAAKAGEAAAAAGAGIGEAAGKLGEKTNESEKTKQEEIENDIPENRLDVLNDLEKWINDQGANLNQKELADKFVEFAKTSEHQWNAMRDAGYGEIADPDQTATYSKFTNLLFDKLTDQGERDRIKHQIPWVLRPGE